MGGAFWYSSQVPCCIADYSEVSVCYLTDKRLQYYWQLYYQLGFGSQAKWSKIHRAKTNGIFEFSDNGQLVISPLMVSHSRFIYTVVKANGRVFRLFSQPWLVYHFFFFFIMRRKRWFWGEVIFLMPGCCSSTSIAPHSRYICFGASPSSRRQQPLIMNIQ